MCQDLRVMQWYVLFLLLRNSFLNETIKLRSFHFCKYSLFFTVLVCKNNRQLALHLGKNDHGDVCRDPSSRNYDCPNGCVKNPTANKPFCLMDHASKLPCRLGCPDDFPRLQTFSWPSRHGNVCRKRNNNNYRCPRGCKKTTNGKVPFCHERGDPRKPCRKP